MGTTEGVATSQGPETTNVSWVLSPEDSSWQAGRGREPCVYLLGGMGEKRWRGEYIQEAV